MESFFEEAASAKQNSVVPKSTSAKQSKKLPGASIEEALNFMKDQGCDLEKIAEQVAANHQ